MNNKVEYSPVRSLPFPVELTATQPEMAAGLTDGERGKKEEKMEEEVEEEMEEEMEEERRGDGRGERGMRRWPQEWWNVKVGREEETFCRCPGSSSTAWAVRDLPGGH